MYGFDAGDRSGPETFAVFGTELNRDSKTRQARCAAFSRSLLLLPLLDESLIRQRGRVGT
jgi:hypothetical protein